MINSMFVYRASKFKGMDIIDEKDRQKGRGKNEE